ncbi:hypothetical protein COB57_04635 [Candidatus Peregrinibacteria bacterium]|nr:MAG: hypothetical protein COB57_04635 [Candidatus Peregrinibacteria bacterium]
MRNSEVPLGPEVFTPEEYMQEVLREHEGVEHPPTFLESVSSSLSDSMNAVMEFGRDQDWDEVYQSGKEAMLLGGVMYAGYQVFSWGMSRVTDLFSWGEVADQQNQEQESMGILGTLLKVGALGAAAWPLIRYLSQGGFSYASILEAYRGNGVSGLRDMVLNGVQGVFPESMERGLEYLFNYNLVYDDDLKQELRLDSRVEIDVSMRSDITANHLFSRNLARLIERVPKNKKELLKKALDDTFKDFKDRPNSGHFEWNGSKLVLTDDNTVKLFKKRLIKHLKNANVYMSESDVSVLYSDDLELLSLIGVPSNYIFSIISRIF